MKWFNIVNKTSGLVIAQVYGCNKAKKVCKMMQKGCADKLAVEEQK